MTDFFRDLRRRFRLFLRAPGFAVTAILTIAPGIGATRRCSRWRSYIRDSLRCDDTGTILEINDGTPCAG